MSKPFPLTRIFSGSARHHPNSEYEQALIRVLLGALLASYVGWVHATGWQGGIVVTAVYIAGFYVISAIALAVTIRLSGSPSSVRRVTGILLDTAAVTGSLIVGGVGTAAFYGGYLWVTIANGLRFGPHYMYFANAVSIVSFTMVLFLSDFWRPRYVFGLGLMLWLVLLPFYVAKLLHKLEDAVQRANSANRAKSRFLANMSHEIRTPLTAIVGFSESLLEQDLVKTQGIGAAETITRNGRHLQHIIDEILDLSKIEAGKLQLEIIPCSLFEMVEDIRNTVELLAREKGLAFLVEYGLPIPSTIRTDPVRFKEILLNICNNAIKFTEYGSVRINITWSDSEKLITFSIIDTGIGMNEEQMERVFDAFAQADSSTTRRFGGTGLGLTICKLLSKQLGAKLSVQSEPGHGTRFDLSLPLTGMESQQLIYRIPSSRPPVESCASRSVTRLHGHVLLSEDNPDNQKLVSMYLRKVGLSVTIANNGKEAVEQSLTGNFDLILMDMQMPVMDGLEATSMIRSVGDTTPIVALTANAMQKDVSGYLEAGCDGFLAKPIDRNDFVKMLTEYLSASEPEEQLIPEIRENGEFADLVERFLKGLPAQVQEIASAQHRAEWSDLAAAAHKLKGMGGSFGFPDLTELAADLETASKRHAPEDTARLVTTLRKRVADLLSRPASSPSSGSPVIS